MRSRLTRIAILVALGAGAFAAGSCAGELDDPERFLTTSSTGGGACPDIEGTLFPQRCGTPSCHNATDKQGGLDLVSPGLPARVVGVPATAACGAQPLADPTMAVKSVLYVKLTPDYCGPSKMPQGSSLTDTEIDCVRQWIESLPPAMAGAGGAGGAGTGGTGGAGGGGGAGGAGGG
jgi:hypothetical protein